MNRLSLVRIVVVGGGLMMTVGCCDEYKQKIATLEKDVQLIQSENDDLKKKLLQSQERADELAVEVESKSTELAALKAELASATAPKPAEPTQPAAKTLPAGWQETATGAKITLASDILFAAGRAALSSKGRAALKLIAGTIRTDYAGAMVRVYGFTDSDPIVKSARLWKDNLDLSANRAMAVTRELRRLGVPDKDIESIAMGATNFLAPNTTKAGKAKNRRVEIVVIRP